MHPIFYHFSSTVVMYLSAAILADTQKKDPKYTLYLFCLLDTYSLRVTYRASTASAPQ